MPRDASNGWPRDTSSGGYALSCLSCYSSVFEPRLIPDSPPLQVPLLTHLADVLPPCGDNEYDPLSAIFARLLSLRCNTTDLIRMQPHLTSYDCLDLLARASFPQPAPSTTDLAWWIPTRRLCGLLTFDTFGLAPFGQTLGDHCCASITP